MNPDRIPFAVLAHHRSGSNFLVEVLRANQAISCLTEPLAQHLPVFIQRDVEYWPSPIPAPIAEILADSFTRSYLAELRAWLISGGTKIRGFKETRLAEKLDWFETSISPIRSIVLIRDPRAVTASILARPQLIDYWIDAAQLVHLPGVVNGIDINSVVARSAAIWTHRYSGLLDRAHKNGALIVRLESLVMDPESSLAEINKYLGISHDSHQISAINRQDSTEGIYSTFRRPAEVLTKWHAAISPQEERLIVRIAGSIMERSGYSTRIHASIPA
jgi:hypothetical protein